jgi:soluble lytic murein transglycosylase
MTTVPTYNDFQATPGAGPGERFSGGVISPAAAATGPAQLQQFGQALQGTGDKLAQIESIVQYKANLVPVQSALNTLQSKIQARTYGTQDKNYTDGFVAQKGEAALALDADGKGLQQRQSEGLQDDISQLTTGLANDQQKSMFTSMAAQAAGRFNGQLQAHAMQEHRNAGLSAFGAAAKIAGQNAEQSWDKPDQINNTTKDANGNEVPGYIDQVKSAIQQYGDLAGKSANEIALDQKNAASTVHTKVVEAALQNNNPTYANQYMQMYKDQMTPDDLLKANGVLNRSLDAHVSQTAVTATAQHFSTQLQPPDFARLQNIVTGMESGGKDYTPAGAPVTSPKGAKYAMQVMPDTAKDPGMGIAPAKDDSPEEYNRVGQQYLGALVQKYGNAAQAMAAYNAGPGAADNAIAKAKAAGTPEAWASFLPTETQKYVKDGVAKLNSGGGAPPMPTVQDFVQDAVGRLGPDPRPEQVALTTTAAERQYGLIIKSRNEQGDQALRTAQQALVQNGGDFANLDPGIKSDLVKYDPGKYDDAMKYAKAVSAPPTKTDTGTYLDLVTHPDLMAKMPDSQFMQLATQLSDSDFKKFAGIRASYINGKTDDSAQAINNTALNTALNSRLVSLGINPTPGSKDMDERARVGTIQKYVRDSLYAEQQQTGKKMAPAEINTFMDNLFAKDVNFKQTFLGFTTGTSSQQLLTMKTSDIPGASLDQINAAFAKRGVPNPTDDQRLRAYWTLKNGK